MKGGNGAYIDSSAAFFNSNNLLIKMYQIVVINVKMEKGQRESLVQDEEMCILVNKVCFCADVLVSHRAANAALFRIKRSLHALL